MKKLFLSFAIAFAGFFISGCGPDSSCCDGALSASTDVTYFEWDKTGPTLQVGINGNVPWTVKSIAPAGLTVTPDQSNFVGHVPLSLTLANNNLTTSDITYTVTVLGANGDQAKFKVIHKAALFDVAPTNDVIFKWDGDLSVGSLDAFVVTYPMNWTISYFSDAGLTFPAPAPTWLNINNTAGPGNKTVTLEANGENLTDKVFEIYLKITAQNGEYQMVYVRQNFVGAMIVAPLFDIEFNYKGVAQTPTKVKVEYDGAWDIALPAWVEVDPLGPYFGTETLDFSVWKNTGLEKGDFIYFYDGLGNEKASIFIYQEEYPLTLSSVEPILFKWNKNLVAGSKNTFTVDYYEAHTIQYYAEAACINVVAPIDRTWVEVIEGAIVDGKTPYVVNATDDNATDFPYDIFLKIVAANGDSQVIYVKQNCLTGLTVTSIGTIEFTWDGKTANLNDPKISVEYEGAWSIWNNESLPGTGFPAWVSLGGFIPPAPAIFGDGDATFFIELDNNYGLYREVDLIFKDSNGDAKGVVTVKQNAYPLTVTCAFGEIRFKFDKTLYLGYENKVIIDYHLPVNIEYFSDALCTNVVLLPDRQWMSFNNLPGTTEWVVNLAADNLTAGAFGIYIKISAPNGQSEVICVTQNCVQPMSLATPKNDVYFSFDGKTLTNNTFAVEYESNWKVKVLPVGTTWLGWKIDGIPFPGTDFFGDQSLEFYVAVNEGYEREAWLQLIDGFGNVVEEFYFKQYPYPLSVSTNELVFKWKESDNVDQEIVVNYTMFGDLTIQYYEDAALTSLVAQPAWLKIWDAAPVYPLQPFGINVNDDNLTDYAREVWVYIFTKDLQAQTIHITQKCVASMTIAPVPADIYFEHNGTALNNREFNVDYDGPWSVKVEPAAPWLECNANGVLNPGPYNIPATIEFYAVPNGGLERETWVSFIDGIGVERSKIYVKQNAYPLTVSPDLVTFPWDMGVPFKADVNYYLTSDLVFRFFVGGIEVPKPAWLGFDFDTWGVPANKLELWALDANVSITDDREVYIVVYAPNGETKTIHVVQEHIVAMVVTPDPTVEYLFQGDGTPLTEFEVVYGANWGMQRSEPWIGVSAGYVWSDYPAFSQTGGTWNPGFACDVNYGPGERVGTITFYDEMNNTIVVNVRQRVLDPLWLSTNYLEFDFNGNPLTEVEVIYGSNWGFQRSDPWIGVSAGYIWSDYPAFSQTAGTWKPNFAADPNAGPERTGTITFFDGVGNTHIVYVKQLIKPWIADFNTAPETYYYDTGNDIPLVPPFPDITLGVNVQDVIDYITNLHIYEPSVYQPHVRMWELENAGNSPATIASPYDELLLRDRLHSAPEGWNRLWITLFDLDDVTELASVGLQFNIIHSLHSAVPPAPSVVYTGIGNTFATSVTQGLYADLDGYLNSFYGFGGDIWVQYGALTAPWYLLSSFDKNNLHTYLNGLVQGSGGTGYQIRLAVNNPATVRLDINLTLTSALYYSTTDTWFTGKGGFGDWADAVHTATPRVISAGGINHTASEADYQTMLDNLRNNVQIFGGGNVYLSAPGGAAHWPLATVTAATIRTWVNGFGTLNVDSSFFLTLGPNHLVMATGVNVCVPVIYHPY